MYAKFQKLLDDAKETLSSDAYYVVRELVGDNPDPDQDAFDLRYRLDDPATIEDLGLEEPDDTEAINAAYDFLDKYKMLAPFPTRSFTAELAKGSTQAETYANIFNAIHDYTWDSDEIKTLTAPLDQEADPYVVCKPFRGCLEFEDGSSVEFVDCYAFPIGKAVLEEEKESREIDKEYAKALQEDRDWGECR